MSEQIEKRELAKGVSVWQCDCLHGLRELPDASVDAFVTDPPYGLGRAPDPVAVMTSWIRCGYHEITGSGFMGQKWDAFVPQPIVWREVYRVLKHGGHVLAFAGTRTQDWMAMSLRFAGFEIRDLIAWVYGSGFPKSLDVRKAIDKAAGAEREVVAAGAPVKRMIPGADQNATGSWIKNNGREFIPTITAPATAEAQAWDGWGTALKPALEPITLARKPLSGTVAETVLAYGTGALNVDACRVGFANDDDERESKQKNQHADFGSGPMTNEVFGTFSKDRENYSAAGRFPANFIHDGSPEVVGLFPETKGDSRNRGPQIDKGRDTRNTYMKGWGGSIDPALHTDSGSAARFFYTAKASKSDREEGLENCEAVFRSNGNKWTDQDYRVARGERPENAESGPRKNTHPTVKPTDLMRYLCRLITPPGGLVVDPYVGSGTTGKAAVREGFRFLGMEMEPESVAIACRRIDAELAQGDLFRPY